MRIKAIQSFLKKHSIELISTQKLDFVIYGNERCFATINVNWVIEASP